jgi:hypothetical protein
MAEWRMKKVGGKEMIQPEVESRGVGGGAQYKQY